MDKNVETKPSKANTGSKSLLSLFFTFLKIGAFTFGGGYAMIALIENEFVTKKKWLTQPDFLDMVAISESTPGPVAINSATYIGYKCAGLLGALLATLAVCLPSFVIIYAISLFFDQFLSLTYVAYAFKGIQVCVVYLIGSAGVKLLKSMEKRPLNLIIVVLVTVCMVTCSVISVQFSSIYYILVCAVVGWAVYAIKQRRAK
jgi:chromate transporter